MNNPFYVLGYDIGGTKVAICLAVCNEVNEEGVLIPARIVASKRIPGGSKQGPDTAVPQMKAAGTELLEEQGVTAEALRAVGVCAPGPLDVINGEMLVSPNMPLWDRVPIVKELEDYFEVPVKFENDANGAVLAEYLFGTARGKKNAVYLTMSTGVGAGVIVNGQLVTGHSGLAGELGHNILDINGPKCGCGMNGCLEAFCGGKPFEDRAKAAARADENHPFRSIEEIEGDIEKLCVRVIRDAAFAGHEEAGKWWDEFCLRLAQGIGIAMMTFNPEVVVLGTIAIHSKELLLDPVREYLPRFAWKEMLNDCEIEPSILGTKIGELAGVAVALYTD
jgi:glucokinase